jgi:acyl-CoA synthetase (AMP-forming)/AMP-acid ligase II
MWLPHFHDNGLVHGVIQPLFNTFRSVMMSPLSFVQHPFRWLEAISRYHATHSGGPNFAYGLCTRRVSPKERDLLDLRSWRCAYNAAEPVRRKTLDEFTAAFSANGFRSTSFYPAYGLAEATLLVSIRRPEADLSFQTVPENGVSSGSTAVGDGSALRRQARVMVGCGQAVPNTRIVIACPNTLTSCPPGREGEVWVAGPSVAAGYWNRAAETQGTFNAFLADSGEGPFLRTGDLGFLCDGELFVTGRIKDLVIIRGQNHHPQDIECTVEESHSAINAGCCAAFSIDAGEDEGLVIVAELPRRRESGSDRSVAGMEDTIASRSALDTVSLGETIRQAIAAAHGVHVHALRFVRPGAIPRTSSGKIQRHACKADFLAGIFDE